MKYIFCLLLTFFSSYAAFAYTPPIGIPDPTWGTLHPIDTPTPTMEDKCPGWPSTVVADCYYIDPTTGTDISRANGTPNAPRATIPGNKTFVAGSYIYMGGQQTALSQNIKFNCSEENPCWITGDVSKTGGFRAGGKLSVTGDSQYLFIDNLKISNKSSTDVSSAIILSNAPTIDNSVHHMVIRNTTISDVVYNSASSVVSAVSRDIGNVHDIIFYNIDAIRVGDPEDTIDHDLHTVGVLINTGDSTTSYVYNVWVLDSTFKDSTQGLQVNAGVGGNANLHHVYVGRNYGEHERQRSFSTKQGSNIIFSQNEVIPGVNRAAGGYSEGLGWSLGADNVWFLFNKVHGGVACFRNSDSTGGTSATSHVYIIGNLCYDSDYNYQNQKINRMGQAISLDKGGSTVHIVDNTFVNTIGMIKTEQADTLLYVHGNLFYQIDTGHSFLNFYTNTPVGNVAVDNNLYYAPDGNPQWNYTSTFYASFESWSNAYPQWVENSLYVDPLFTNILGKNYRPTQSSPVVDANTRSLSLPDVYATFQTLYGLDIRKSIDGTTRPVGSSWDIGAYEYTDGGPSPIKVRGFRVRAE